MALKRKVKEVANVAEQPAPTLLEEAQSTILGPRQQEYGDKLANFTQIATGINMVLARKLLPKAVITAHDVALIMMQVKIARSAHNPTHRDSLLDIAGYAGCADTVRKEAEKFYIDNKDYEVELCALDSMIYAFSHSFSTVDRNGDKK